MKKKFVLTLALVLMVAVSLTAAPIELSGSLKAGYAVTLESGANGITSLGKPEVSLGGLSVSGDFWKVSIADETAYVPGDDMMKGTATIYLSKALAAQGMDMGELSLEMVIGNKGNLGDLSVYSNKRDKLQGLKMASGRAGAYATSMTVGYGDLVHVMVGADPVSFVDQKIAAVPAYGQFNPITGAPEIKPLTPATTVAAVNAFVISAKTTPIEGVSAAIGFTNVSLGQKATNSSADGAISGSVMVDVAKLAGLDFGLAVSAYDLYNFGTDKNNLYLEVKGSYADIHAWTEYRILDTRNDMKLKVEYAGIENLGLSAGLELDDITKKVGANEVAIGAGIEYKMGGVTYGFEGNYKVDAKSFTMSPSVKIKF